MLCAGTIVAIGFNYRFAASSPTGGLSLRFTWHGGSAPGNGSQKYKKIVNSLFRTACRMVNLFSNLLSAISKYFD
jgi:hypothetical protein